MLNNLLRQLRQYDMVRAGDCVYCAVSGGADSMALLWAMYLLKDKLEISLRAAHFNHHLRGEESDRDEGFVREFCQQFDIPLIVGHGQIVAGEKGLEAAAREARYAFFDTLQGKIATAHTADDNAETVLMHMVRGTGLKGLGGIAPVRKRVIRPMLNVTRQQVLAFLDCYHVGFVEDSTNDGDGFLRNRLRHHVMPLLKEENLSLAESVSRMAQRLREDEAQLQQLAEYETLPKVEELKALPPAVRGRMLERFLRQCGVKEPESEHIALAEKLVFSKKPSATAQFPHGVTLRRNYGRLEADLGEETLSTIVLDKDREVILEDQGLRVTFKAAETLENTTDVFTVANCGLPVVRCRISSDEIQLSGGTKSLKKLMIDRKIPAAKRLQVPVVADELGVLGVYGVGVNEARKATTLPAWQIRFDKI